MFKKVKQVVGIAIVAGVFLGLFALIGAVAGIISLAAVAAVIEPILPVVGLIGVVCFIIVGLYLAYRLIQQPQ